MSTEMKFTTTLKHGTNREVVDIYVSESEIRVVPKKKELPSTKIGFDASVQSDFAFLFRANVRDRISNEIRGFGYGQDSQE